MDCDDNTETTHQYQLLLPQEILEEEIFYRLPVKSLLRFRCLSKSWRSLIDSSHFIKNHYHRNSTTLAHHRVIFDWERGDTKQCSLQSMLDQPRIHPSPSDQDTDHKQYIPTTLYASIVGCCNGLFCLINVFNTYILWNPATKTFFNLPQVVNPTSTWLWTKWGFGWDETTSAYKVFALSYYPIMVARVYSSKTNSWKSDNHGSYSVRNKVGLCVCKNLHWLTRGSIGSHIEAFDLKSDSFGKMELPWEGAAYGSRLGEVRGCLGVLRELENRGGAELWVMKEHGVKESWQILMTIAPGDYRSQRCLAGPLLPSGDMLLISGENFTVVCAGMAVKHKKIITSRGRWRSSVNAFFTSCYEEFIESLYVSSYNTYVYVESLVSPLVLHFFTELACNPH